MRKFITSPVMGIVTSSAFALAATNASADSIGGLAQGQWTDELKAIFMFVGLFFAFVGFILVGVCLYGIAAIKMFPNAPGTQRFESAGVGGLSVGAMAAACLMVLSGLAAYFFGSVAGDGADSSAFDRLKSSGIYMMVPNQGPAAEQLDSLIAKA